MREFKGFKKGIDLGGWLSQCGEENYNDAHYSSFIVEQDIEKIASWGLDHVRLPFDCNVVMTDGGEFIESGFSYIDRCVEWCEKYDLSIVLDLHKTVGFVFDNLSCFKFFEDEGLQDVFVKLWAEMARRYGSRKNAAFELLNEVTDPNVAEKWNKIAARTVAEIRKITKDTRIIIGGINNNSIDGMALLEKPADENIVFTFHCYSPLIFTHQKAYWVEGMPSDFDCGYPIPERDMFAESRRILGERYDDNEFDQNNPQPISVLFFERVFKKAVETAEKFNVPLYCGEYGVIDRADAKSALNWFRDIHAAFEKFDIGRAVWCYKEKDFGITGGHYADIFGELVKLL